MKQQKILGAITIGQAPRVDITKDILPLLPEHVELREYGALANQTPASAPARLTPTGVNLHYPPSKIPKAIQAFCIPVSIFIALKGWLNRMDTESIDYQKHFITFFPFDGIIIT